jgi:hypothetical protein
MDCGGPQRIRAFICLDSARASSTRKTIGVPPTGVKDLQRTPAALATGSSGPRSAASTTAVNFGWGSFTIIQLIFI